MKTSWVPPPRRVAAIRRELSSLHMYPEGPVPGFKKGPGAKVFCLQKENVVISNGADNLLVLIASAFMNEGEGGGHGNPDLFNVSYRDPDHGRKTG